jgi:thiosulfate reductase cytochrome b subunit
VFLINGFVYVGWNLYSRHVRNRMLPARDEPSAAHLSTELRDQLSWRSRSPHAAGQLRDTAKDVVPRSDLRFRTAHDIDGHRAIARRYRRDAVASGVFAGRQTARTLHTIGTVMLVLFVIVHVLEVVAAGSSAGFAR